MTTRSTPFAPGIGCWADLFTTDPDRSADFYKKVLGWTAEDTGADFGGYTLFRSGDHQVAGMMRNTGEAGTADMWSTYFATLDVEATVARASDAGAHVVAAPMEVADLGTMAVLIDPVGAVFGLWQAGQHTGFTKYDEPGSVTWNEHLSRDFTRSSAFYADLFGWEYEMVSDTEDFRYATAKVGGEDVAGLMDAGAILPDDVPSHWSLYLTVADVDAALADVDACGGAVLRPAEDSPYGRIAEVADPTGVPFRLHQFLDDADATLQ